MTLMTPRRLRARLAAVRLKTILSLLLFLALASPAWGAKYYVKATGNDILDGLSDETAWASIGKVTATVSSGDTVYFRSQDTWEAPTGSRVLTAKAGVTYDGSSYGSGTRARLKAKGPQTATPTGNGVVGIFASDVTLRGFEIDGGRYHNSGIVVGYHATSPIANITIDDVVVHDNGDPAAEDWCYGLLVASTLGTGTVIRNVRITNSTFYNNGHEGIAIYQSRLYPNNRTDGVLIRNCVVHDTGVTSPTKTGVGILLANDSDNVTIEYCTLYRNMYGIWIRTSPVYEIPQGNGAPDNMVIRYNYIYDNYSFGICIVNPQGANKTNPVSMSGDFYGNIVANTAADCLSPYKDGWDLYIGQSQWNETVLNFYNNTFFNVVNTCTNSKGAVSVERWSSTDGWGGAPIMRFVNNIVFAGNFIALWDKNDRLSHSNNLIYRSSGASDPHVYANNSNYDRNGVLAWEPTAQNTNPNFTGGTLPTAFIGTYGSNLRLNTDYFSIASGPALDHGVTLGSPYDGCINGAGLANPVTRPQGTAYDIGAYENTQLAPPGKPGKPHLPGQNAK